MSQDDYSAHMSIEDQLLFKSIMQAILTKLTVDQRHVIILRFLEGIQHSGDCQDHRKRRKQRQSDPEPRHYCTPQGARPQRCRMNQDPKDQDLLKILKEMGDLPARYPEDLMAARRAAFLEQVAQSTLASAEERPILTNRMWWISCVIWAPCRWNTRLVYELPAGRPLHAGSSG